MTRDIDFLRKILIDKFGEMPLWVRVTTYLAVLLVSIYVLLRPNYLYGVVVLSEGGYETPFREGTVEIIYESQGMEFEINERGIFAIPLFSKIPGDLELRFTALDGQRYPVKLDALDLVLPRQIKVYVEPGEPPKFRLEPPAVVRMVTALGFPGFGGTALAQAPGRADGGSVPAIVEKISDGRGTLSADTGELPTDSIQRSLIVGAIEEAYGIAIPAHDWKQLRTLPDVEIYVARAGLDLRVRKVLRDFADDNRLYIAPTVPSKKLSNAREAAAVPANETVIGLLDATVFGSARESIVFGQRGIYYRTSWTRETGPRVAALAYRDFPGRTIEKAGFLEISLGQNEEGEELRFVTAGSAMDSDDLIALLTTIQGVVQQVTGR